MRSGIDFWRWGPLAGLLLVLAGCGGAIPKTHYYVLSLPPSPNANGAGMAARPAGSRSLAVLPLRAPEQLEQDRIVYRPSPVELDYYDYHRWAQRPTSVLTEALVERLRASHAFSAVFLFDGRAKPDYLLRTSLERLDEIDSPGNVTARADISAEIVELKTGQIAWTGSCSQSGPVGASEVKSVVEGMSRVADDCLKQITASIETFAKSLPPAPASTSAPSP